MSEGQMKIVFFVQGEGKGHFSQALVLMDELKEKGKDVPEVFIGKGIFYKTPAYFKENLDSRAVKYYSFFSPSFLRSPDRKGITIWATIFTNLLLSPLYFFESLRIAWMAYNKGRLKLVNFYDPVAALTCRWWLRKKESIAISHHFYLSHPDFIHPHGMEKAFFWLHFMNRIMIASHQKIRALSFRKGSPHKKIVPVPPLVQKEILKARSERSEHWLAYFLEDGFAEELLSLYEGEDQVIDIFTGIDRPNKVEGALQLYSPSRTQFMEKMLKASRIICTAGFDTLAEAFSLGIPVFVIPVGNHYEQYCNALDAARTGMAFHLEKLDDMKEVEFEAISNESYKKWLLSASLEMYL